MWIQNVLSSLTSHSSRRRPTRRNPPASRLVLEPLEDRRLLSFSPAVSYAAGVGPQGLLSADFNGDGRLDLATANAGSNTVSVLLGNANGTFQPAVNSATGAYPWSLAAGDLNADGKLDLATVNQNNVSVLLGNGNGSFGTPTNIDVGSTPESVAVGDFNGDGKLDLGVTSNVFFIDGFDYWGNPYGHYDGRANVLLGNRAGSLAAPIFSRLGYGYHQSAAVADFNGDGKQDFAAVTYDAWQVSVLPGAGTGAFGSPTSFGTRANPLSMVAADVNGDSKVDLVTTNSGNLSVLLGNGLGAFATAQNYSAGASPQSLAVADFSGDGKADLATANPGANNLTVLLGIGDGVLSSPVNSTAGGQPRSMATGDFNGDGWPDAATSNNGASTVSVMLNDHSWTLPAPFVNVNSVTVTEGNTGSTSAVFTVSLSYVYNDQPTTVHYQTSDGLAPAGSTANAGSDYTAASGDVTFAPGETIKTITVAVLGDRMAEYNETFEVRLTSPSNALLGYATGVGTILDDEPHVSIDYGPTVVTEGNTGTTSALFTVRLAAAYDVPVSVNLSTVEGDTDYWYWGWYYGPPPAATSDVDFQAASATLTFVPGETIKTVSIAVYGDRLGEPDEYFSVNLSDATIGSIDGSHAVGIITDDEPYASINNALVVEGNTGTAAMTFTVTLSATYDAPVTVTYATADGSATSAGGDYQAKSDTLTFAPGETSKLITVLVNGDRLGEDDESFYVQLTGATGSPWSYGTIRDDEPRLSTNDVSLVEGNTGATAMTFTVSLSFAYDAPVTVNFATANGSATLASGDYQARTVAMTFAPGVTTMPVSVLVNGDRLAESDETFYLQLSSASGALIIRNGVGTIVDNEPRLNISDVTKAEGKKGQTTLFIFTVTLSAAYDQSVTMSYRTVNGTATSGSGNADYVAKTGTLTFAPGETSKTITIEVEGDNKREVNETFYIDLFANSSNSLLNKSRGLGTILNDD